MAAYDIEFNVVIRGTAEGGSVADIHRRLTEAFAVAFSKAEVQAVIFIEGQAKLVEGAQAVDGPGGMN